MGDDDLMVQQLVLGRTEWGTRVYADGRVEEYGGGGSGDDEGWDVGSEWRPMTRLSEGDVRQLRDVVRRVRFFDLPAHIEPESPVYDGVTTRWTVRLGGKRHEVTVRGSAAQVRLQELDNLLQKLIGDALNREADRDSGSSELY